MEKVIFCTEGKAGSEHCPNKNDKVDFYTQVLLQDSCEIPCEKPNSQKIINTFHSIDINNTQVLGSEVVFHGKHIQGKKVVVTGIVHLGIQYLAQHLSSLHYLKLVIPFSAIITPETPFYNDSLFSSNFNLADYDVYGCPEHVEVVGISDRIFEISITLMIWLQKINCIK